jgi:hypothetical protein
MSGVDPLLTRSLLALATGLALALLGLLLDPPFAALARILED